MAHLEHESLAKSSPPATIAILTVSDTRTEADDTSGQLLRELVAKAGAVVCAYAIVKDSATEIKEQIAKFLLDPTIQLIITTGGTGISQRDVTPEALAHFFVREIPGFGEVFRTLSFEGIGAAAMLSRALAGQTASGVCIFALPGSSSAVRLGMERLILPQLKHITRELTK